MQTACHLTEMKFPVQGISLYGVMRGLKEGKAAVQLQRVPEDRSLFGVAVPTELTVMLKNGVHTARARVLGEASGTLLLELETELQRIQRRGEFRYPCELEASFRPQHDTGCAGAWQSAHTEDVSMGGIRLRVEPFLDVPAKVEMIIVLKDLAGVDGHTEWGGGNGTGEAQTPVRALGRVRHYRLADDGCGRLGISFAKIIPNDRLKLAQFLAEAMSR